MKNAVYAFMILGITTFNLWGAPLGAVDDIKNADQMPPTLKIEFNPLPDHELIHFGFIYPTHKAERVITIECIPTCKDLTVQIGELPKKYSAIFVHDNKYGTDGYIQIMYAPGAPGIDTAVLHVEVTGSDGEQSVTQSGNWHLYGKASRRD